MRIIIFTNSYRPVIGGIETSIILFRRGLLEAGHEVHIIAPEYHDYEDEEPYVFRVPSLQLPRQLADASVALASKNSIETLVHGIRPHLIHTQHPFLMGSLGADIAQDMGIPLVYTYHTRYDTYAENYVALPLASDLANLVLDEMSGRFLEKCTHIIAPTPSVRDYILETYDLEVPVTVVPTPVDLSAYTDLKPEKIRRQLQLENAELLLYVGRFAPEKNLGFLLKAFTQIATARPRAKLLLVGKGPEEEKLRKNIQQLHLTERVIFVGPVSHDEVPHYTAAADLFVFSSTIETQGLALVEAMAAGTPVVAVKTPGPADVLAEGGGVLVPEQESALAEAVINLLADRDCLLAMKAQARQSAQRYSIAATTAQLLAVYQACRP